MDTVHKTTGTRQERARCEIPDCESPAVYRGTCSPDHYQQRALRRQAALHRIPLEGGES